MRRLLLWWLTILDDTTAAQAAVYALLGLVLAAIVFFMLRGLWGIWHYTPDEGPRIAPDPRPTRPGPPRAAGSKARRVA